MNVLIFLGNALLSVVCSITGNMIDRFVQSRKKVKGSPDQDKRP